MEFTRLNWVISLYVKIQEVKKPRVQPKMEFRAYGMGFGNSRCLVRLNIFCERHAQIVYQPKLT